MNKTIHITDCKRPIELPVENYLAHQECVDHWCNGGEVEHEFKVAGWDLVEEPKFLPHKKYRIKQREPRPGEVWLVGGMPQNASVVIQNRSGDMDMLSLRSLCLWNINAEGVIEAVYAAPSVKAYIARQMLGCVNGMHNASPLSVYEAITKAAQLGEELLL